MSHAHTTQNPQKSNQSYLLATRSTTAHAGRASRCCRSARVLAVIRASYKGEAGSASWGSHPSASARHTILARPFPPSAAASSGGLRANRVLSLVGVDGGGNGACGDGDGDVAAAVAPAATVRGRGRCGSWWYLGRVAVEGGCSGTNARATETAVAATTTTTISSSSERRAAGPAALAAFFRGRGIVLAAGVEGAEWKARPTPHTMYARAFGPGVDRPISIDGAQIRSVPATLDRK